MTISIILTVVALIVFGVRIYQSLYDDNSRKFTTSILLGIITIAVAWIQPYTLERVDSGFKGIKVNLTGSKRGVSDYQYATGWVAYNSWTEQMLEFPTYQQHIEYDSTTIITKGGFSTIIRPTFNYSLKPDKIGDMFVNLRLEISDIEQGWLKTAIIGAVNDVANQWEVDAIFNNREKFENAIMVECNERISKWFSISQLRTNIVPPASIQDAIEQEVRAIKQAQAENQKAKTAEAEARKKIAIAKGDSAQVVIRANAEAQAIKIKQTQINATYIEYIRATKWDGKMPSTVVGNGSSTLLNIK